MRTIDHSIIREILFWASESDSDGDNSQPWPSITKSPKYDDKNDDQFADWIEHHLKYLKEREFIDTAFRGDSYGVRYVRLLPSGWDHLDTIKDESFWKNMQKIASEKGKELTFEFIKVSFKVYITKALSGV